MSSRPLILSVKWASTLRESNLYQCSQKIPSNENSLMNGLIYSRQASLLHRPVAHDLYRTSTVNDYFFGVVFCCFVLFLIPFV